MERTTASRTLLGAVPTLMVAGLLGLAAPASPQPQGSPSRASRCSNRTLLGDYGSSSEGKLLIAPGVALEFRGLTMTHFDGRGNVSWVEHTVIDGAPVQPGWVAATGTYTVSANCTGTMVVDSPNSPVPLNLALVVVKGGSEVRSVLDANAIITVFSKVD